MTGDKQVYISELAEHNRESVTMRGWLHNRQIEWQAPVSDLPRRLGVHAGGGFEGGRFRGRVERHLGAHSRELDRASRGQSAKMCARRVGTSSP